MVKCYIMKLDLVETLTKKKLVKECLKEYKCMGYIVENESIFCYFPNRASIMFAFLALDEEGINNITIDALPAFVNDIYLKEVK